MRKLFCVLVILLNICWVNIALAQNTNPNYGIFFQAVARDNYSNPAKDRVVFVESSILQFTANGTKVLTELHQTTTDGLGVFSINIGSGQRLGGTLSGLDKVDWANGPYFLGLKIAIKPLSPVSNWDYTKELIDLGASSFGTVPYAYYAGSAGVIKDVVKTSDTAAMLLPYAKANALQQTNTNLALKVNLSDSTNIYVTPTQLRAVKFDTTFIYNRLNEKELLGNKSLSVTTDATSDTKYPSVRAIKSYVDLAFSNFVLADGSVTASKIANGAVTDAKITSVSGAKVTGDIAGNAATATLAANATNATNASTATLAASATKLATPRTINGVSFDGTSNITIPTGSTVTDADAITKGIVQLAGDLTGTAALPVVTSGAITTSKIANGAVTDAKITSVAGSKVIGDIAGNAATATLAANATNAVNATNAATATLAATATKLATPRTINGVAFDGTSNITIATGSTVIDADATTKGVVQLAGDLTGTAAQPVVAANAITTAKIVDGAVTDAKITSVAGSKVTGTIALSNGGTGATNVADARTNLGVIAAAEKGANNGVATLGNDGKIPSVQIPSVSFQSATVVANQAAMLALSNAVVGSIAIRTDNNNNYVLSALPATTLSNWIQLATPSSVTSVNGYAGPNVVLTAADVNGVEVLTNKSNNVSTDAQSTTKYPSVKAIKDYVDQQSANAGVADNSITSSKISGTIAIAKGGTGATTAADARTNLGLVIGTDVMSATATTTLTGDIAGSGNGTIATTVNSVGGVSSNTISTFNTRINANTASITANTADILTRAPINSPAFTGTPTAPTPATSDNSTKVATTEYVKNSITAANAGISSIGNISGTSNVKGATISGTTELILTPADATNGGILTSGAQTIAGAKTFNENVTAPNFVGDLTGNANTATTATTAGNITATANTTLTSLPNLNSVGTITSGTWSGTTIAIANGGTGATNAVDARTNLGLTIGTDVMAANATTTLTGDVSGTGSGTFTTTLSNSGVTAGSYGSSTAIPTLTVDSKGRITSAGTVGIIAGVNSLNYTSTSSYANGGTISGTALTLAAADATNPGLISTGAQTIAGAKTFNANVTAPNFVGDLTGNASTATNATTATTAGNITATANTTITSLSNLNTVGTITSGTWSGTAIAVANGGTGATTAADARTNLGLRIGTDVMAANATTTLTGDITGSGSGTFATTINSVGGVSSNTISTFDTRISSNTNSITTITTDILSKAPINSPIFTGTPTAPTPATSDNSTKLATTEYVKNSITAASAGLSSIGTISATSNAKGAVISGTTELILTPADGTNGGIVTAGTQTIGGAKTFNNSIIIPGASFNNGTAIWEMGGGANSTGLQLIQGGCCARLRIDDNGRFAIGANYSPSTYQFDVQGDARFTQNVTAPNFLGNATTATTATTAGNITATANTTLTSLSNLNTVGTITSGTWSGTTIAVANGGTGATSAADARTNLGVIAATEKGANNGVATLGNDGKIPSIQIPSVSFQSATVVANQAAMLALNSAVVGSIAIRTDNNNNYVLSALPATTLANWIQLATPSSVTSVNGNAGPNVVLTASDISGVELASNKSTSITTDALSTTKYPSVKLIKDYVDQQSANAGVADNSIASSKISGAIAIAKGGTGATTASDARTNLGLTIGTDVMAANATTTLTGDVTGSGSGTFTTTLSNSGVTAGSYGSSTAIPTLTLDSKGRVIAASTVGITAGVSSLNYTSTTSYASGGTISGTALTLSAANGTNPGLISTGAQTIAGAKTFNNSISIPGASFNNGTAIWEMGGAANSTGLQLIQGGCCARLRIDDNGRFAIGANYSPTTYQFDVQGDARFTQDVTAPNFLGNATTATTAGNITATANTTITSLSNLNTVGTITSGTWSGTTIAIAKGGTGATTALDARTNLGLGSLATKSTITNVDVASGAAIDFSKINITKANITGLGIQDALTAGSGISISAGTISATGLTTSNLAGNAAITNSQLANSSTTLGSTTMTLGGTVTSVTGLSSITSTGFTGTLTGNASTATKLAATKNINGVAFDGSADITVAANAGTLTGTTLASNVVSSSLTSVGTISSGTWSGTTIDVAHGGTGVTSSTGTGSVVLSNSPTLVTPIIGAATGTSLSLTGNLSAAAGTFSSTLSAGATTLSSLSVTGATTLSNLLTPTITGGSGTTSSITYKTTSGVGTTTADHIFQVGTNGGTEAMRITNAANIGVGTSSPTAKLDVAAGTTTNPLGINLTGSIDDFLEFNIKNNSATSKAQSGYNAMANNGNDALNFAWMGINNSIFNNPQTYNIGIANDVSFLGAGNDMYVANASNKGSIVFSTGKAVSPYFDERLRITNAGTVAIGTTGATSVDTINAKLHIAGKIKLVDGNQGAGKVLTSDANGLSSWTTAIGSTVVTSTSTYAITLAEAYVFYTGTTNGAFTIPAAAAGNAGKAITIKNKTAYNITITPASGNIFIDNANASAASVSIGIEASNNWIKLVSDGTQWNVFRALF